MMKVELQCGDTIAIPEGCKAIVKDGCVVFEKEEQIEEKKEAQEFKEGDVLCSIYDDTVLIFKDVSKCTRGYFDSHYNNKGLDNKRWKSESFSHATEEEKQLLFDKMEEQGLQWNAEEKRVEKIRWRAKYGEEYWYVTSSCSVAGDFMREENSLTGSGAIEDWSGYNHFRKKAQAAEAARRVKEALKKYCEEIGE